jgi:hypothetical protein
MRICSTCKKQIGRNHRWHEVNHSFLWFHWKTVAHHNCTLGHECDGPAPKTKRLPGEVPLPFLEPVELSELPIEYHGGFSVTAEHSVVGYHSEGFTATPAPEEAAPIPAEDRIALSRAKADELIKELA